VITTLAISVAWIVYSMIPPLLLLWYTFIGRGTTLKLLCRRGPAAARLLHGQACSMGRCAKTARLHTYTLPRLAAERRDGGHCSSRPMARSRSCPPPASRVNMTRGILLTAQEG
jgi:hypothetical protein